VALKLFLDTWRWSGVPFFLRSGKRLSRRVSELSIHFKQPPFLLFPGGAKETHANTLIIRIQPEEGITINMNAKIPGYSLDKRQVNMDFNYGSAFGDKTPEAYERLLLDSILGDSTLYTRRDEIESSWTFITRILSGWERNGKPVYPYVPGSAGPVEAEKLLSSDGRRWRKL
jgi:glucose-6-phosphate 1-dehydrogenase